MKREYWVDQVKILACIIVAVAHLYESMVKSGVLADSFFLRCFDMIAHYSAVQLFFICSGYLYQKNSVVNSISSWKDNIVRKLIAIGIPYFVFSIVTWLMKSISPENVNHQNGELFDSLFVHPIGQYWYLYILFFIFLITPTLQNKRMAISAVAIAFVLKLIAILSGDLIKNYLIGNLINNEFWFVLGMLLCLQKPSILSNKKLGFTLLILLVFVSIAVTEKSRHPLLALALELLICISILMIFRENKPKLMDGLIAYTMPIYLLHTICAAVIRTGLFRLGASNHVIQIIFGALASIVGPIIIMTVLERLHLDFLVYPNRLFKKAKRNQELRKER